MRIAVNTRFLLPDKLEGIGRFTLEVVKRIVLAHPEHEFIFFFDRPYHPRYIFASNVRGVVLFPPARHPLLFVAWFEVAVRRALRQHRPDVFLSTDGFLCLGTSVPTAMVVHDLAYLHFPTHISRIVRWYYQYFVPRFVRRADHIFTVSDYTRRDLLAAFPDVLPERVSITYNGCNPAAFPPSSLEVQKATRATYTHNNPYFVYVGAIHPRKNVLRLLKAFELFRNTFPDATHCLVLVGRMAWDTNEITDYRATMRHREAVVFLDYVPHEALPRIIGAAAAMVYVSLFEGFGIPLLEAMWCEVPVITSSVSSMLEVAGEAGILVDPTKTHSIADGLAKIYEGGEALRSTLVARGKQQRELFSWDVSATEMMRSLEVLAQKKNTP